MINTPKEDQYFFFLRELLRPHTTPLTPAPTPAAASPLATAGLLKEVLTPSYARRHNE